MLKTYFQIAVRNLSKDRVYSLINILGLTVGLACFILIFLFVKHELSYDTHYQDSERIYRVASQGSFGGSDFNIAVAGAPVGEAMQTDYPEVEAYTRFRDNHPRVFRYGDNFFTEDPAFVDYNFFEFFGVTVTSGNSQTALAEPNMVAFSETLAKKVFGESDPIGKVIEFNNGDKFEVKAVYKDIPSNTHFHFPLVFSLESRPDSRAKVWLSQNFQTYIKIAKGTDAEAFERKIQDMIPKYMGPEVERFLGKNLEEFQSEGNDLSFYLQQVQDIHLHSNIQAEIEPNSDIKYIYIFSAIGAFILLIASINYMNLATARSANRAKEVGIRKVMGAYKPQLMLQFISESVIIALIGGVLAILISYWSLPYFNALSGKNFDVNVFESFSLLGGIGLVALFIGIISGSYPAFYLSAFKPSKVLKGAHSRNQNGLLRNILVVFQFAISIFLIVGTMVIFDQMNFVRTRELGFEKEHKVIVRNAVSLGESIGSFKEELLTNTDFENATITSFLPSPSARSQSAVFKGTNASDGSVSMQIWMVDHDFIKTMGMTVLSGRDFSSELVSDSSAVILNQSAAAQLGFDDPLNKRISMFTGQRASDQSLISSTYNVVGVINDFNFNSLRENITPLIMILGETRGFITFDLNTNDYQGALETLEAKWAEFAPGYPFNYAFLDDALNEVYAADVQIGKIFGTFASVAIFIACLGLFALSSFTAEQRSKEIGIRKVLGASVAGIMSLLSKEFVKLMTISFVIAAPLSYLAMNVWLSDFAYRTPINISTFVFAGLGSFLIAWLTMSYQSLRAAQSNPVNTLRDE